MNANEEAAVALARVVGATASGRLLRDVHRCLLHVRTPRWQEGWTGAAGVDDGGRPASARSAIRIASVTKTVAATALLVLCDRRRWRLDQLAESRRQGAGSKRHEFINRDPRDVDDHAVGGDACVRPKPALCP